MYTLFWKEIMATNRATVQVKEDNINEKAASMQQGLCKCGWGAHVTGEHREREAEHEFSSIFPPTCPQV